MTLIAALIANIVHFYVVILFRDGTTPARAWIVNGALLCVFVIAAASLLAIRSRRWATILGVLYVAWIVAFTAFLVHVYGAIQG